MSTTTLKTQLISLQLPSSAPPILQGHLKLGGTNPQGQRIGFTNLYMTRNGQPCIPVMGEFHFSRYARRLWADELLKIKAGGVEIVATYVFWNHVEEDEGQFDWSGDNDLREFVTLCGQAGLQAMVRLGPFAHGECRNGGLPDWLYGRPFAVRSNDPRYLAYVRRLYGEIAAQLDGLLFKDGGAVIGVQVENEYMHAGAPWEVTFRQGTEYVPRGEDGAAHLLALKRIAREAGLDVPIYSATGWLGSPIPQDELLPMQGGYFFTPWVPDPDFHQPPTREFLFRDRRLHPVTDGEPTYDPARYPYACCEIGAGTEDTYFQRNPVPPQAVESFALMFLAGGANLIGYYMYHGGTNPVGKHGWLNEHTVPRRSYDFQAPLGEFGQTADSYRSLRLLHLFLRDFGDLLAPMRVTLPENAAAITPDNTTDARCAVRSNDDAGFLFLNNFQDHVEMQDIDGLRFQIHTPDRTILIPQARTLTLQKDVCAILPFGLSLDGLRLRSATVQLLTRLDADGAISYVFFAPRGMVSEYVLERDSYASLAVENGDLIESGGAAVITVTPGLNSAITLTTLSGTTVRLLTLTREQAEQTSKQTLWGGERLVISAATLVADGWLYSRQEQIDLLVYPPLDSTETTLTCADAVVPAARDGLFTRCQITLRPKALSLSVEGLGADQAVVHVPPDTLDDVENVYLRVDYVGDIGSAFLDGKLVSDNFCNGTVWEIGLKQVTPAGGDLFLRITPLRPNATPPAHLSTGMAFTPATDGSGLAMIRSIRAEAEYKVALRRSSDV